MRFSICRLLTAMLALVFAASCGNYMPMNQHEHDHDNAVVNLSMTDAPPSGVNILSFEVSLTGATLSPGNVDLLNGKGPIRIEVKQLETENAFLSTATVPAGTYTTLNLTFANPEITFQNTTGGAVAGCAPGAVCEVEPKSALAATVNGSFNIMANSQSGLLVDLNLASVISNTLGVDFSAPNAVTAQQQSMQNNGELEDLDDVTGVITSIGANQFTLQTSGMNSITIAVNGNTAFNDFENCMASNFTCLKTGQSVEADLLLMGSGSFLAKKVELADGDAEQENENEDKNDLEGVVFKVDSASQFEIVVLDEMNDVANVSVGNPVIVMLQSNGGGASFEVDSNGLTVPSALQNVFENSKDTSQLIPGQTVQIRTRSMSGGPAPAAITISTDRVRLRETRFTATVSGTPSGANFTVGSLPGVFTAAGVMSVQVQTSSQTNFNNVSGVAGLTNGSTVSLRGLLFEGTPSPTLIADKVIKR